MNFRKISFVPLYPGELPGDPEMGGWRPLPKHVYRHRKALALSLEQAVKLITFRLMRFELRQAIKVVTHRLVS